MVLVGLFLELLGCDTCNFAVMYFGVAEYVFAYHSVHYPYLRPWCMQMLAYKGEADKQFLDLNYGEW